MIRFLARTRLLLLATSVAASAPGLARAAELADPSGVWLVEDGDARVRIEHCERAPDKICGYLVWTKEGGDGGKDTNNPDPAKRDRAVLGSQLVMGLEANGDDYAGKLYNAENGKTYDVKIWREDATHMKLKGCVLKYLCKSQTWTEVADVAPGQLTGHTDGANGPRADAEFAAAEKAKASGHKRH